MSSAPDQQVWASSAGADLRCRSERAREIRAEPDRDFVPLLVERRAALTDRTQAAGCSVPIDRRVLEPAVDTSQCVDRCRNRVSDMVFGETAIGRGGLRASKFRVTRGLPRGPSSCQLGGHRRCTTAAMLDTATGRGADASAGGGHGEPAPTGGRPSFPRCCSPDWRPTRG